MCDPTFTNCSTAALENVNNRYTKSIRYQIKQNHVNKVNNADKDLDTMVHVEAVDAPLAFESLSEPIININISTLKRGLEEAASPPGSPKKAKKSRKTANNITKTSSPSSEGVDEKRRVGCPFFKKDGSLKQPSCNGKGWPDPGKMKDHLKSVHKMDHKWLNDNIHFKEKPYFGEPIDVQWKLAFQKLFPQIPKDEIPSPYIDDTSPPLRSAVSAKDTDALGKIFRQKLLDEFRIEQLFGLPIPVINLNAAAEKAFNEALQDWRQYAPVPSPESFDYVQPDTWPQMEDHYPSPPENTLLSLAAQTLTSLDLPMSPRVKTESLTDLSPRTSRYLTPEDDDDAKPVIEAIAEPQLIQPLEQVAKVDMPCAITSTDQDYAFTAMYPLPQPIVLPFGQEYPFSDTRTPTCTPQPEQPQPGLPSLGLPTVFECSFMGFQSPVRESNASISRTSFTNHVDPNEEIQINGWLDSITNSSGDQLWNRGVGTACQELDGLIENM